MNGINKLLNIKDNQFEITNFYLILINAFNIHK